MQRWRRLCLVVILLAVPACGGDKPPPDHAALHPEETAVLPSSLPTAPPTTAPPTTPALGEQVTTVEAAQRLLDLFAHLDGEAARMLLAKGSPDAEFDQALQAVYVEPELGLARKRFTSEALRRFSGYAMPQPDVVFHATEVVDARRDDCVVVRGSADLRARYTNRVDVIVGVFVIVDQSGIAPGGGNPTTWRMLRFGEQDPGSDLEAICPGL